MLRISLPVRTLLLAALTLAPVSQSIAAPLPLVGIPLTSSQQVDVKNIDLTNEQGWKQAQSRIEDAAQAVCSVTNPMDMTTLDDISNCVQSAKENALADLRDIRTNQRRDHRVGHVLLAARPVASPHG
ncbi:UrcA family protein [Gluconobacter japonicus]|uniref:UrcA family protein n=1 Tax=Gluconobacter japonicus TaxID=376620 RepID=UPI0024AC912E|nr:UrcA family protein [Gluconobacter japonicus]MDI6652358.1 UrcA family protein [Gluconobacter japonicus]